MDFNLDIFVPLIYVTFLQPILNFYAFGTLDEEYLFLISKPIYI